MNMTESVLRGMIRGIIREGVEWSVKIDRMIDILEGMYERGEVREMIRIDYQAPKGRGDMAPGYLELSCENDRVWGSIEFYQTKEREPGGEALGGFRIIETFDTTRGIGPLLYEILIEKASESGSFLMSDREEVSEEAKRVWDVFMVRSDIKKIQLDINREEASYYRTDQLTPDFDGDDTSMAAAITYSGKQKWKDSSLSKGYAKENLNILQRLRDSDLIDFVET